MTPEELAELKRANDLQAEANALKKQQITALNRIADRPAPIAPRTGLALLWRKFNAPLGTRLDTCRYW